MARMQKDAQKIMNSERSGFSIDVTLTLPDATEYTIKAIMSIIHNLIDPDTGQPVSGFFATASINSLDLLGLGVDLPEGEMDSYKRPWTITAVNVLGNSQLMKITRVSPDETNGNILCELGTYER